MPEHGAQRLAGGFFAAAGGCPWLRFVALRVRPSRHRGTLLAASRTSGESPPSVQPSGGGAAAGGDAHAPAANRAKSTEHAKHTEEAQAEPGEDRAAVQLGALLLHAKHLDGLTWAARCVHVLVVCVRLRICVFSGLRCRVARRCSICLLVDAWYARVADARAGEVLWVVADGECVVTVCAGVVWSRVHPAR